MSQAMADVSQRPIHCSELNTVIMTASVAIGGSGAVDPTQAGNRVPGQIVMTNTGTGTFSLTFPASPNCTIEVFPEVSAAATVTEAILTAKSPTAGTATIRTSKAGTAANPASGDLIGIIIYAQTTGQAT